MKSRKGFTEFQDTPRPRRRVMGSRMRLLAAIAAAGLTASAPLIQTGFSAKPPDTTRYRWTAPEGFVVSDAGFLGRIRPDHNSAAGVPLKAGWNWTGFELGESTCEATIRMVKREADYALMVRYGRQRAMEVIANATLMRPWLDPLNVDRREYGHWLPDIELRRWAWLLEHGMADLRTIRETTRQDLGRQGTAEEHWRVYSGQSAGITVGLLGWYVTTQSEGGLSYYYGLHGDDGNDGLTQETAKKDPRAALAMLRDGYDDYALGRAGDEYSSAVAANGNPGTLSGVSGSVLSPMVIGKYGTSGDERVIFDLKTDYSVGLEVKIHGDDILISGLKFWSSTYKGQTYNPSGVSLLQGTDRVILEDVFVDGLCSGLVCENVSGDGPDDVTMFRCNSIRNYAVLTDSTRQLGVGLFYNGPGLRLDESNFWHNGWNEDFEVVVATSPDFSVAGDVVTFDEDFSDWTEAYNGGKVRLRVGEGDEVEFSITDYDGDGGFTVSPTPDAEAWTDARVIGSAGYEFCHNTYVDGSGVGFEAHRCMSVSPAHHGFGRTMGVMTACLAQDATTGFIGDGSEEGVGKALQHCAALGPIDHARTISYGIVAFHGYELWSVGDATPDGHDITTYQCIAAGLEIPDVAAGVTTYGWKVGNTGAGNEFLMDECVGWKWSVVYGGNDSPRLVSFQLSSGNFKLRNSTMVQAAGGSAGVNIGLTGSATVEFTGNTWFGDENLFYNVFESQNMATWAASMGETGYTYADPEFSDPGRNLTSYEEDVLEGGDTLRLAMERITGFKRSTWNETEHGVVPRLNHVRAGYDMTALELEWPVEPDTISYLPTPKRGLLVCYVHLADGGVGDPLTGGISENVVDDLAGYLSHGDTYNGDPESDPAPYAPTLCLAAGFDTLALGRYAGDVPEEDLIVVGFYPQDYGGGVGGDPIEVTPGNELTHRAAYGDDFLDQIAPACADLAGQMCRPFGYLGPIAYDEDTDPTTLAAASQAAREAGLIQVFDALSPVDALTDPPPACVAHIAAIDEAGDPWGTESWEKQATAGLQTWRQGAAYMIAQAAAGTQDPSRADGAIGADRVVFDNPTTIRKRLRKANPPMVLIANNGSQTAEARLVAMEFWVAKHGCTVWLDAGGFTADERDSAKPRFMAAWRKFVASGASVRDRGRARGRV